MIDFIQVVTISALTGAVISSLFATTVIRANAWLRRRQEERHARVVAGLQAEIARLKGEPVESEDPMRVISKEDLGNHTVRVTTESKRYGRVVRNVLILPESIVNPEVRP